MLGLLKHSGNASKNVERISHSNLESLEDTLWYSRVIDIAQSFV